MCHSRKFIQLFEQKLKRKAFEGNQEEVEWKEKKSKYLSDWYQDKMAKGCIVTATGSIVRRRKDGIGIHQE